LDFNVISSPFEVVEYQEIHRDYQQAVSLPLASSFKLFKIPETATGEFSGEKPFMGSTLLLRSERRLLNHLLVYARIFRLKTPAR